MNETRLKSSVIDESFWLLDSLFPAGSLSRFRETDAGGLPKKLTSPASIQHIAAKRMSQRPRMFAMTHGKGMVAELVTGAAYRRALSVYPLGANRLFGGCPPTAKNSTCLFPKLIQRSVFPWYK